MQLYPQRQSKKTMRIRRERALIAKRARRIQDTLLCLLQAKYGKRKNSDYENLYIDPDIPVTMNELKSSIYPNFETEFKDIIIELREQGFTCPRKDRAKSKKPPREEGGQYMLFGCRR